MCLPLLMKLREYIRKAGGGGDGNRLPFAGDKACPGWAVFGGVGDIHVFWVLWIKLDRYSIENIGGIMKLQDKTRVNRGGHLHEICRKFCNIGDLYGG